MKLSAEEKEYLNQIENDEWNPVSSKKAKVLKEKMEEAARNSLLKDQRINIRISKQDLDLIKTKALEEGLPYQTLISSLLHKFATGKITNSTT